MIQLNDHLSTAYWTNWAMRTTQAQYMRCQMGKCFNWCTNDCSPFIHYYYIWHKSFLDHLQNVDAPFKITRRQTCHHYRAWNKDGTFNTSQSTIFRWIQITQRLCSFNYLISRFIPFSRSRQSACRTANYPKYALRTTCVIGHERVGWFNGFSVRF